MISSTRRGISGLILLLLWLPVHSQGEWEEVYLEKSIDRVQPMTGIVFWTTSSNVATDAISLEFSYMLFKDVVSEKGVYNWEPVEKKLDLAASRGHQVIFRFRYVYPGYETSVPEYILNLEDYEETVGKSEGKDTHFPDWTHPELKRFTMEFYTKFAERYGDDPRLAFIQVGFGLWAEYHIYSGPFVLGGTFPSKEFQEEFFHHLDTTFKSIPWSISIDAADDKYTPFKAKPQLKDIPFGLFDDSFMHKNHSGYNTSGWNFFDRERYRTSPAGGEFSYYSSYDQEHVLDYPDGPYGKPFEDFAMDFHISYMFGNDQPRYQSMERIKEASMASGYRFKLVSIRSRSDSSLVEITNRGPAPIYYDAYIAVDGVRSETSLKLLSRGDTLLVGVAASAAGAEITIESDKLLEGQEIQFFGTQEVTGVEEAFLQKTYRNLPYPNPVRKGDSFYLEGSSDGSKLDYQVYDSMGIQVLSGRSLKNPLSISTGELEHGIYLLKVNQHDQWSVNRFMIF